MSYSAACFEADFAASIKLSNAVRTRSSKPGLLGAKDENISFGTPERAAAAKNVLRRDRNLAASSGLGKSATRTDQLLSYTVHSGDRSSGVPKSFSRFGDIERKLPSVSLSQRYKSCAVATQNKNDYKKTITDHSSGELPLFTVILPVIGENLRRVPAKFSHVGKRDTVPGLVCHTLFGVSFELHSSPPYGAVPLGATIERPIAPLQCTPFHEENQ